VNTIYDKVIDGTYMYIVLSVIWCRVNLYIHRVTNDPPTPKRYCNVH